ncbi:MBL fold metallo-hydrolase [Arhodomonas sp. AD133]|uniref:MBL fold metallo-hydrolase n=1 Tax=Arhodomonas sp. AD133 TaxID=3415009 RepID=UPI003EBF297E
MSLRVQVLSGFGAKAPAAVYVSHAGRRLLLDAGGPMYAGQPCDWYRDLDVDAVVLSHDHFDHVGAVANLPLDLPVYCTPVVARALPPGRRWHALPYRGRCEIAGVEVTTGLAGHSLGGVWIHLGIDGGVFYSGDASLESLLFPFDVPPPAATALFDASYGLYDGAQADCRRTLARRLDAPTVLPAPASGRALEFALWLHRLGSTRDLTYALDETCRTWLAASIGQLATLCRPAARAAMPAVTAECTREPAEVLVVADESTPDAVDWVARYPDRQVIHTGYRPPGMGDRAPASGTDGVRWNVHPRARDLVYLARRLGARRVVPLFGAIEPVTPWQTLLGPRLAAEPALEIPNHADSSTLRLHAPW